MERPSILEGLQQDIEYLKTMSKEERIRIAEDY